MEAMRPSPVDLPQCVYVRTPRKPLISHSLLCCGFLPLPFLFPNNPWGLWDWWHFCAPLPQYRAAEGTL